ncbi:meiosis-specific nuclear structural protein 1 [Eurytemora carolleeae]|uniref:meiosis-specific nuclear structural protein 1 n=1 Tax=Eurytemora carolleeae TaxID=1294199 RepID=UPI000C768C6B|nr:meiosis-specific nuclear structural protein 1 [Eurytemora carolleeae]|eukprot:XP_023340033.1 meiosis-specific nuclear structural protein 1-like [Eurytemora affinis]
MLGIGKHPNIGVRNRLGYPLKRKYLPEDRIRQKIVQGSLELRTLASQLEQAYINKERAAQLAEKRAQQQIEENERRFENEEKEKERLNNLEKEKQEIRDDALRRLRYQKELDEQLKLIQEERNKIFNQFIAEKEMIDSIVTRIHQENQEQRLRKLREKVDQQTSIQEYLESNQVWRERENQRTEKENRMIKMFLEEKERRDKRNQEMETERRQLKNQTVLKLSEQIRIKEEEKLERERLLLELLQFRNQEKDRLREEQEIEDDIRRRVNLRESNILAAQYRKDKERREEEEDERWKEKMMQKFAEDDKLEQMNEQRRRMKREEHKRAIQEILQDKQRRRMEEAEKNIALRAEQEDEERRQRSILEEERRRMLQEHIQKLEGYIPKGVLTQSDLNLLGEQLNLKTWGSS